MTKLTTQFRRMGLIASSTILLACALTACGGGGGGGDSTGSGNTGSGGNTGTGGTGGTGTGGSSTTTIPTGTTQSTATYAAGSAEAQIFASINTFRGQCGFPAYQQNTILDQAAKNHANYMIANGAVITDTEVQGNTGFTGTTGQDRANAQGWPTGLQATAADAGAEWTNATLTAAQYGQSIVDAWASGVYHQATIAYPASLIGVGAAQTTLSGFPEVVGGVELAQSTATPASITTTNNPLTFPCQGVTGVPYKGVNEEPTPPNTTAGGWGTPVTVMGNPTDVVNVTAATMTSPDSTLIQLNVLNSTNDAAGIIGKYQSVAYPLTPLQPNTTYSVNLSGTVNGVPFSRQFTFTTGNTVG